MVGTGSLGTISAKLLLNTPFGNLLPLLQPHLFVKTSESFRINWSAVTLEKHMDAPIALANARMTTSLILSFNSACSPRSVSQT